MKILMPATHYHPVIGGIETWTKNIAEGLSKKAEVFVVTGKVKGQLKKEEMSGVKIWRTSLFTLSDLSASPIFYSLTLLPFVFFKSLSLIKEEKINLLHCQGFLSSFLGFLLSKITGLPYIVTVQRLERTSNPLKNLVYRQAACCIAASAAVKKNFEAIGVKKIEVIPNGIDLKRFNIAKRRTRGQFTLITVARLEKVKGVEFLIKAIKSFPLLIIGDGSQRKSLESLAEKIGVKDRVKFLGQIPNQEIPSYLAKADCFVLPSLKEGFGIVILEAQAAGLPVVASGVGVFLDLVKDGKTGLLVEPGSSEAISQAVFKVFSHPELAQKLIKNSKANLVQYNWDNIVEKVYRIYQKTLR